MDMSTGKEYLPWHSMKKKEREIIVRVRMPMRGYHEEVVSGVTTEESNRTPSRVSGRSGQELW